MNDIQTLHVAVKEQPKDYDILIGQDLLKDAGMLIAKQLGKRRCIIVTDSNVAMHHLLTLEKAIEGTEDLTLLKSIILPAGENTKGLPGLQDLMNKLFDRMVDRKTLLIALGGGMIGDITGFAASITMRSIDYIQIPTTLLAQVDSSVGGKTAINSLFGKNTIGAFYQPRLVIIDVNTLNTLPKREILAGYGEATKYGLILDGGFFEWCRQHGASLVDGNTEDRIYTIEKSCSFKAQVVEEDEKEKGKRALLNLGHTFAHALESVTGYGDKLLHGEAVAIGCLMAFDLSHQMGLCAQSDVEKIRAHFEEVGLPIKLPKMNYDIDQLMTLMAQDKKAEGGRLTLILANGIGQSFVAKNVDPAPVRAIWRKYI